jgi:hypothetical protein
MRSNRLLLIAALIAVCTPLALAGDMVAMPTGDSVPAGQVSLNYIYWKQSSPVPALHVREYTDIGELFVGVTDRLELDYLIAAPNHWSRVANSQYVNEFNAYYTVIKETPKHPSLIVGATNLTGNDWLPSSGRPNPGTGGENRVSPFVVSAYNLLVPKHGPPSWQEPVVRLQMGWGTGFHEDQFFGGVESMIHPKWGFAILDYQVGPAYGIGWRPGKGFSADAAFDRGWPLIHIGWTHPYSF